MPSIAPYRRPYWNTQPEYLFPKYASTVKRAPSQPLVVLPHTLSEVTAPVFGHDEVKPGDELLAGIDGVSELKVKIAPAL